MDTRKSYPGSVFVRRLQFVLYSQCSFQASYRHKITGEKSHAAKDVLGGILADDMGLGKTLMMIAAITFSTPHAESHASDALRAYDPTQSASKLPVKSTLVIVSNSR